MSQQAEKTTSWGSTFQDVFSVLTSRAADKYLAPDVTNTVERPAGTFPASKEAVDWMGTVANNQKMIIGGLLGLVGVLVIVKIAKG